MADGRTNTAAPVDSNPYAADKVDYTQYRSWEKVTAPNGKVYYRVPGNPGLLLDPFLSAAKGRPVLVNDPSAKYTEAQKAKEKQQKAEDQQLFNQSPTGQLLPVVAGTGGIIAAQQFIPKQTSEVDQILAAQLKEQAAKKALSDAAARGATGQPAPIASAPNAPSAAPGFQNDYSSLPDAAPPGPIGSNPADYNSLPNSDGSITSQAATDGLGEQATNSFGLPGSDINSGLSILAAAKGAYDTVGAFNNGGAGLRTGLAETGAGIGNAFLPGVGGIVGGAGGNVLGYGLKGNGVKNDLALAAVLGPMALIPGVGNFARGLIHKTVQQTQGERLDKLNKQGVKGLPTDLGEFGLSKEELVARETANGGNATFAQSRDEKDLGVNDTLNGVQNFEVVGDDYMGKWSDDQRRRYNQLNLDAGNVREQKGGLYYKDKTQAEQFRDQVNKEGAGFDVNSAPAVATTSSGPIAGEKLTPQSKQAAVAALAATPVHAGPKWIHRNGQIVKVA